MRNVNIYCKLVSEAEMNVRYLKRQKKIDQ